MKTKYKQVRQGVFESNSSSTNAFTLSFDIRRIPDMKPIIRGPIWVYPGASTSDSWAEKLGLLAGYMRITNKDLNDLVNVVKDFCGDTVEFNFEKFNEYNDGKYGPITISDYFEDFSEQGCDGEYGNSEEDIIDQMEDILSTPEKTLSFLFSYGHIIENEYYDG